MEYLPKLVQMVLKSRVALPGLARFNSGEVFPAEDLEDVHEKLLFEPWRVGTSLHIDISLNQLEGSSLLERWSLHFSPSGKKEHIFLPLDGISEAEKTEFVLLIQSLYGHVRTMPVSDLIAKRDLDKEQLTHCISVVEDSQARHQSPFSKDAKDIQKHTFNLAEMSFGSFALSVLFLSKQEILHQVLPKGHERNPAMPTIIHRDAVPDDQLDFEDEEDRFRQTLERGLSGVFDQATHDNLPEEEPSSRRRLAKPITINTNREASSTHSAPFGSPIPSPKSHSSILSLVNMKYSKGKPEASKGERSSFASSFGNFEDGSNPSSAPIQIASSKSRSLDDFSDDYHEKNGHNEDVDDEGGNLPTSAPRFKPSPRPTSSWASRRESSGHELFGSLLGSYEESILNGRMSTTPSKPIEFVAELGVVGKGKCKPSLKCPPHAVFNFQAFFYQLKEHDSPTPYVGTIDLQASLAPDSAPQLHPGFYRIPPKGLLQLILKNPNKTVVKIFLVNYDFSDMPASSKTFLRQTSHSTEELNALRYAIHMKVFCNNKRKIYLHSTIRVVFSHRVPDGTEKLKVTTKKADEYLPLHSQCLASPTDEDF